jgi:hypothetical protein
VIAQPAARAPGVNWGRMPDIIGEGVRERFIASCAGSMKRATRARRLPARSRWETAADVRIHREFPKMPTRKAAQRIWQETTPEPIAAACQSIRSADTLSTTGISSPSALAVLRLMTNSNLVDCWTGRLAGLAPLRMLPV